MILKVEDATDADVPIMMHIDNAAYEGSAGLSLLYPNGRSPDTLALQERNVLEEMREDPSVRNIKVISTDDDSEKLIAFARWRLYHGSNLQYLNAIPSGKPAMPEADPAGLAMWNDMVRKRRIEHIGRTPHCYLSNLATHPEYRGRGAGTALIRWGCEVADNHGVPAFVQSSPAGYQAYKKCGFEEAYAIDLDLTKVGLQGVYRTWLMVRYSQEHPRRKVSIEGDSREDSV